MKKLLLVALLFSAGQAQADAAGDTFAAKERATLDGLCSSMGEFGEWIMTRRQRGDAMTDLMKGMGTSSEISIRDDIRGMIRDAYDYPQLLAAENRITAERAFRNDVEAACYKTEQEKLNKIGQP